MARVTSTVFVSALVRLVNQLSGHAYINRHGSDEAGAIYLTMFDTMTRSYSVYEPVPQAFRDELDLTRDDRVFTCVGEGLNDLELNDRFEREARFDPDFWVVEIEGVEIDALSEIVRTSQAD